MDDPSERSMFEGLCDDLPVTLLEGSRADPGMSPESRLIQRQIENMEHAIPHLITQGYTWLIHMDMDELLFGPLFESKAWANDLDIGLVTFTNHEAIPVDYETLDPFRDCVYFWVNGINRNKKFMAYSNGKSAVRLGPGVKPSGPHWFSGHAGRAWTPPSREAMLLHYPYPSYRRWLRKFDYYGAFSNHWFGDRRAPKIMEFMLRSRDVVQKAHHTNDWLQTEEFFRAHIPNNQTREKALSEDRIRYHTPFSGFDKD